MSDLNGSSQHQQRTAPRADTWMPFFIAKYLGDTQHLTRDQHGGYILLIFAYWMRGSPLPDDDGQLAAIVRATPREWKKSLRPILQPFFIVAGGFWHHKRVDRELLVASELVQTRSRVGKIGAESRWQRHAGGIGNGMPEA